MAIIGLGIDIINISRIKSEITRNGNRLAYRILHYNEQQIWKIHKKPVYFLAKRFAAKEAATKAFGTGIGHGLALNQFEIFNNTFGKPCLRLWGNAQILAEKLGVTRFHLSLSDEKDYACAIVIIEV